MNRYRGNSGRREVVPEPAWPERPPSPLPPPAPPPPGEGEERRPPPPPGPPRNTPPGPPRGLGRGLDGVLARLDPGRLDTEDLLVLAILWLLYRESGDREMLIALGAYLLL